MHTNTQSELGGLPPPWSKDDTEAFLTAYPLPSTLTWPGKDGKTHAVTPKYKIEAYGKWLRETPYYPGLFDAVHEVLLAAGDALPDSDERILAALEPHRARITAEIEALRPKTPTQRTY